MASKINPKGIFKSNSRSKGPNPKGINPGGINNKPAPKPAVKSPVKPVASKPVTSTTTPRTRGGASKGNTPGTGTKYSGKTPINNNKPVSQGRGGVSKGNTPGTRGKYANKPGIKTSSKTNLPAVKGNTSPAVKGTSTSSAVKSRPSKIDFGKGMSKTGKFGRALGKIGSGAGKFLGSAQGVATAYTLVDAALTAAVKPGSALKNQTKETRAAAKEYTKKHKTDSYFDQVWNEVTGKYDKPKKGTGKPDAKKSERTSTLIKTPSLKDELKKRVGDTKPVKDNPKTNWLDTAKKGNTLKYGIDAPKSKKDDSKKGSLPKAIDKAVRAADGNQPGDGSSLKFTGDRSKVAGKDKWGRSPSDKWYGFNPKSKKYEAPTMVKADTKKAETKPVVKTTPVKKPTTTTPKATSPKVSNTVDKMETKPATSIANTIEAKKEIVQPKATATTSSTSSSTSSSTTPSSSASAPKTQPRATFGNKIRGVLNASRERRAERAEARGNEGRADKLRDKIEDTSKKMVMRKGGTVKKSKKK